MSQIIIPVSGGSLPPTVPTSFNTDSGVATPAANTLNIFTNQSVSNFDNGITDTGSGNTVTIFITNRETGTVTTADGTLTTILTLPLGATPGSFYVYGNVVAFNASGPAAGAYSYSGGYRTDGASATELGIEIHDEFEDAALVTADIFLSVSGNNVVLSVQGVAATSIHWNAMLEYRKVT